MGLSASCGNESASRVVAVLFQPELVLVDAEAAAVAASPRQCELAARVVLRRIRPVHDRFLIPNRSPRARTDRKVGIRNNEHAVAPSRWQHWRPRLLEPSQAHRFCVQRRPPLNHRHPLTRLDSFEPRRDRKPMRTPGANRVPALVDIPVLAKSHLHPLSHRVQRLLLSILSSLGNPSHAAARRRPERTG